MDIRYSCNQKDFKRYTTEEMRDEMLITGLYKADEVVAVYSHVDRMVTLGCMPVHETVSIDKGIDVWANFGTHYFLERREIGMFNIGKDSTGIVVADGVKYELATDYTAKEVPTFVDTVISLFPQNLASHWANGEVVPIAVFCILVAISYNKIAAKKPEEVAPFKKFIDAGDVVMGRVVSYVISFTPYAVLSLIARAVSRSSPADLVPLLSVLVLAYVLCAIQAFAVEGALIKIVGKLDPVQFFKGVWPAGTVAFTSQSSVGTIPVTVNQLTRKLGVNEDIAAFGASLGANLGMPGCAGVWPTLLAVFTIHLLGIDYTPVQYAFLVVLAVVVSIGTVGVPGTATITATALFAAAGLPVEAIILLSPISSIADMARTATNVVGAAAATTLVAATEGQLDKAVYNGEVEVPAAEAV